MTTHALPALAAPRSKSVSAPQRYQRLLPAADAPQQLYAAVAVSEDLSLVAPPGTSLHMVEDEPYVYSMGDSRFTPPRANQAHSHVRILARTATGGSYEARILLRWSSSPGSAQLLKSFDQAAHAVTQRAATYGEVREQSGYRIAELRSPLGLLQGFGQRGPQREYLYYMAEVDFAAPGFSNWRRAVYSNLTGELNMAWQDGSGAWQLNIAIASAGFDYALPLTTNLAQLILARHSGNSQSSGHVPESYSAYDQLGQAGSADDQRLTEVADLAEQPGRGARLPAMSYGTTAQRSSGRSSSSFMRQEPSSRPTGQLSRPQGRQAAATASPTDSVQRTASQCRAISCKSPSCLLRTSQQRHIQHAAVMVVSRARRAAH